MPAATHAKAAEQHEAAAKSHNAAADHHDNGDHAKGAETSMKAHAAGEAAQKISTEANGKSAAHAKK
jgi:hypothetical protein